MIRITPSGELMSWFERLNDSLTSSGQRVAAVSAFSKQNARQAADDAGTFRRPE